MQVIASMLASGNGSGSRRVGQREARARLGPGGAHGGRDRVGVDVDADDGGSRRADELERRAARAAGDVEHASCRARRRASGRSCATRRGRASSSARCRRRRSRGERASGRRPPARRRRRRRTACPGRDPWTRAHGRTSKTRLKGVSAARRKRREAGRLDDLADARLAGLGAEREPDLLRQRRRACRAASRSRSRRGRRG